MSNDLMYSTSNINWTLGVVWSNKGSEHSYKHETKANQTLIVQAQLQLLLCKWGEVLILVWIGGRLFWLK